jgi:hypothetical protein
MGNTIYIAALLILIIVVYETAGEKATTYLLYLIILSVFIVNAERYNFSIGTPKMMGG